MARLACAVGLDEDGGEARRVVGESPDVGPPRVLLVQPGPVAHPAREAGLGRRVVEAVDDRVQDSGEQGLVEEELHVGEGHPEGGDRVGHRLVAGEPLPGQAGRRGDVAVDDGGALRDAVVVAPEPALPLREVDEEAPVDGVGLAAVGLDAGEDAVVAAPLGVGREEALLEQLHHRAVEVVAGPADGVGEGGAVSFPAHVEDEGQVGREGVATPALELRRQVPRPVREVQLEAVDEGGPDRVAEAAPEGRAEGVRHAVEVPPHRGGVEVVEDRPVGAGGAPLHDGVALLQDPDVEELASGALHPDPARRPRRPRARR